MISTSSKATLGSFHSGSVFLMALDKAYFVNLMILSNSPIPVRGSAKINPLTATGYWWPKEFRTTLWQDYCLFRAQSFYPDPELIYWYVLKKIQFITILSHKLEIEQFSTNKIEHSRYWMLRRVITRIRLTNWLMILMQKS